MKKIFLTVLFVCCLLLGFAPPTEAGIISQQQEIEMGRETAMQLEAQYGVVQDEELQARVNRIGQRLVSVCGRQDIEYSFKVLNSNEVNALACPGGFIYVFKGLTDYMPTDAELAGVLGHEIGHIVEKHTVHQIEKQMLTTLVLLAVTRGEALGLVQMAQQALFAGYSRTDERGADKEGFYNTVKAGYNPYSMIITLNKLDDLAAQQGNPGYGLFSSHPEPEERVKRVMKLIDKLDVHPDVVIEDDDHAYVYEGDWRFNISRSIGSNKAKYRAYLLAGSLWTVRQRGVVNPDYFVVYDNGSYAHIYYDDIQLLTVYSQEAGAFGTAGNYAAACTDLLRQWAAVANANDANAKAKKKK